MTVTRLITDPASTGTWTLVPGRSSFTFSNKTLWGLVPVNGRFTDVTGQGQIAADGQVSGRIQLRVASVKTVSFTIRLKASRRARTRSGGTPGAT